MEILTGLKPDSPILAAEEAPEPRFDVVLPAGGRISGAFAALTGVEYKALIPFDGETILIRTINILQSTGRVGSIAVVGPEVVLQEARNCGVKGIIAEKVSGIDNILSGLEWLAGQPGPASRVLILTTDLPFLTGAALTHFLDWCPTGVDLIVPVVNQRSFDSRFPGIHTVYVPLRDGAFTLGCAFVVQPTVLLHHQARLEQLFQARKSQIAMARLLGWRFIVRFLARRLTVGHVLERCQAILGCTAAAFLDGPPELAFDIDLPEEYQYAAAHYSELSSADSPNGEVPEA